MAPQPEDLPPIQKSKLMDKDGSFKLNPFFHKGKKYRIIGYTSEQFNEETGEWESFEKYHVKCVTTGSVQYQSKENMIKFINL